MKEKMNRLRKFALIVLLMSFIFLQNIIAGTTGKISGKVIDATTKEPLVGVNVIILETTTGAATDMEGDYHIINVRPGVYQLKFSMVGYTEKIIQNVEVNVDRTTILNVELEPTTVATPEVVVIAEKPVIRKDLTSSIVEISSREIQLSPQRDVQGMLRQQRGILLGNVKISKQGIATVNTPSDELHIRGGREGETAFALNGIVITDPMWGGAQFVQNSFGNFIQEFNTLAGTFNAEYGNAMSGVINVVTKQGDKNKYGAELSFYTDKVGIKRYDQNTLQGDIRIGGPVPLTNGSLTFNITAERKFTDGYLYGYKYPNWVDSEGKDIDPETKLPAGVGEKVSMDRFDFSHTTFSLKWSVTDNFIVSLYGSYGLLRNDVYSHTYKYNREGNPYNKSDEKFFNINFIHALTQNTYYEFGFAKQIHTRFLGVYDNWNKYVQTYETFDPTGNFSVVGEDWQWQNENWTVNTIRAALISQVNKSNLIKIGGNLRLIDLHFDSRNPAELGDYWINYSHKPKEMFAYVQDKMEFSEIGLIINLGARIDIWDPDSPYLTDIVNLLDMKTEQASVKTKFSPRIGISYPISDVAAFHFAYGHFYQLPTYFNLYGGQRYLTDPLDKDWEKYPQFRGKLIPETSESAENTRIANTNMEPEKTVAYEAGIQIKITDDVSLDVTAFYKEMTNLVGVRFIQKAVYGKGINVADNYDYGNAKGVEFVLNKRFSNYFSLRANYTYSIALVTSSTPWSQLQNQNPMFKTFIGDWDRPHTFNCDLYVQLPDICDVSLSANIQSGLPYTIKTEPNTERMPYIESIDLKISKKFRLFNINSEVYLNILNLTDRRNIYSVYSNSGKPDLPLGVQRTPYNLNVYDDPSNYGPGRQVYLGFTIEM